MTEKMSKTYILDTNVLIGDPTLFENLLERGFENIDFVLPVTVIDELDNLKKKPAEVGKKARSATRSLDGLTKDLDVHTGISLSNGNTLTIDTKDYDTTGLGSVLHGDIRILAMAIEHSKTKDVTLVANDFNMRVRARSYGVKAVSYDKENLEKFHVETYPGYVELCDNLMLENLLDKGVVYPEDYDVDLYPNEGVVFKNGIGEV